MATQDSAASRPAPKPWPKAGSTEARNALYPQGLGLLQAVEALKKQMKASYRGGNRAFIDDIDPLAWGLFAAQQKEKKQDLGALRHLRDALLNTLVPSAEALAACAVRTLPEEDTALYSSDEATQLLSDQQMRTHTAFRRAIGQVLKDRVVGLVDMLLDPIGTLEGYVQLLASIPQLPEILGEYVEALLDEEDAEKQAEMVGALLTEAILQLLPLPKGKITQLNGIKNKLGKAAKRAGLRQVSRPNNSLSALRKELQRLVLAYKQLISLLESGWDQIVKYLLRNLEILS